jgi:hypothetical protein
MFSRIPAQEKGNRNATHFAVVTCETTCATESQERQALIGSEQTIQRAFGDVSDALIGYDKYHVVRQRQE